MRAGLRSCSFTSDRESREGGKVLEMSTGGTGAPVRLREEVLPSLAAAQTCLYMNEHL